MESAIRISRLRKTFRQRAETAARQLGLEMDLSAEQLDKAIKKIHNRAATRKPME